MASPDSHSRFQSFATREQPYQEKFARFRDRLFAPLLLPLQKLRVTPNHITVFGLLILIPFAYFLEAAPRMAVLFLWASVFIDGFDGVYARATKTSSNAGALIDLVADHVGMVVSTLLVIHHELCDPTLAAYYAIIYIVMITFSVVLNALKVPLHLTIRTKYFLYLLITIWAFTGANYIPWLMGIFSVTMTIHAIQSFLKIVRRLNAGGTVRSSAADR